MLFLTKTILLNGLLLLILPILAAPAQGEMCLWNNKGGGSTEITMVQNDGLIVCQIFAVIYGIC